MPELAAAYGLGFILCAALTLLFIFLIRQRRRSEPYVTVRENLRSAGLFWSENSDRIQPLGNGPTLLQQATDEKDRNRSEQTIALTGGLLCFLSWAGLLFLLVIMVSYRYLARSRAEKALFASRLSSEKNLAAADVRAIVASLPGSEALKPNLV